MKSSITERLMQGTSTKEGKAIAILLSVCLVFMAWDAHGIMGLMAYASSTVEAATQSVETTTLTYHYNPPAEADLPDDQRDRVEIAHVNVNEEVELPDGHDLSFMPPNYEFVGWATSADGEAVYKKGDKITVDNEPPDTTDKNNLYAVWAVQTGMDYIPEETGDSKETEEITPDEQPSDSNDDPTVVVDTPSDKAIDSSDDDANKGDSKDNSGDGSDNGETTDPENQINDEKTTENSAGSNDLDSPVTGNTETTGENTGDSDDKDANENTNGGGSSTPVVTPATPSESDSSDTDRSAVEQQTDNGNNNGGNDPTTDSEVTNANEQGQPAAEEPAVISEEPINLTITPDYKEKYYGEPDPKLTATITDEDGNVVSAKELGVTLRYKIQREQGEVPRTYLITVSGDETQGRCHITFNNDWTDGGKPFLRILQLPSDTLEASFNVYGSNDTPIEVAGQTLDGYDVYNTTYTGRQLRVDANIAKKGASEDASLAVAAPDITYYAYDTETGIPSTEALEGAPVNAGAYFVTADWKQSDYIGAFKAKFVLVIQPRSITLTSGSATRVYTGSTLTNDAVTVSGDGFVEGDEFEISATGSIVRPGNTPNKISYKAKDGTVTSNYSFELVPGTLTILERSQTSRIAAQIVTASDGATYDGKKHVAEGFVGGYVDEETGQQAAIISYGDNDFVVKGEKLEASVSGTDAGTYENAVKGADTARVYDYDGEDVTDQFQLTFVPGSLVIAKRDVVIQTSPATKVFDSKPLVNHEYTESGWAEGEGAKITVTGSQTEMGNSQNTVEYKLNANTKESNYEIYTILGSLTVTAVDADKKVSVNIRANDQAANYTGGVQSSEATLQGAWSWEWKDSTQAAELGADDEGNVNGVEVSVDAIADKDNTPEKYFVTGVEAVPFDATDAGTYEKSIAVVGSPRVWNTNQEEVTDLFSFGFQSGDFTINPVYYTIATGSAEKVYDGTPLTKDEASISFKAAVQGEDGTPSYEDTAIDEDFVSTHVVGGKVRATGQITNVGSTVNTFGPAAEEAADSDAEYAAQRAPLQFLADESANLTPLYSDYDLGTLTVTPLEVTDDAQQAGFSVTASDVVYNGSAQAQQPTVTYTGQGEETTLVSGEDYTVTFQGQKNNLVDAQAVAYTVTLTGNFSGTLEGSYNITPQPYGVVTGSDTKTYDGAPLRNAEGYVRTSVESKGLVGKDSVSVTTTGSQLMVGSSDNTYVVQWGSVKEGNYTHDEELDSIGTLKVEALNLNDIIVTADDAIYDGTEQTPSSLRFYKRAADDDQKLGEEVSLTPGWYSAEYANNRNAGNASITINPTEAAGDNYVGSVSGSFTIKPLALTLKSATASQQYNTKPFTAPTVQAIDADGNEFRFISGEEIDFDVTGSQTLVGTSDNDFTWSWRADDASSFEDNYVIEKEVGKLTVTAASEPIAVKVLTASDEVTYDGKTHEVSGLETTQLQVANGGLIEVTLSDTPKVTGIDAGTYLNDAAASDITLTQDGEDVTQYFDVTIVPGSLTIKPRAITLQSENLTREFDGTRLASMDEGSVTATCTNDNASNTDGNAWVTRTGADGQVVQEGATVKMTGGRTAVGSSPNEFTYTLNEYTNAENYVITCGFGTITVTSREGEKLQLTVRAADVAIDYDGKAHDAQALVALEGQTKDGVQAEASNGAVYYIRGLKAQATGLPVNADGAVLPLTDVTETPYTVNVVMDEKSSTSEPQVFDTDGNNVTDQFSLVYQAGTFSISPLVYTVTTGDIQKSYSGQPLQGGDITVAIKNTKGEEVADGQTIMKADLQDADAWFESNAVLDSIGSMQNTYAAPTFKTGKSQNYVHGADSIGTLVLTRASLSELTDQGEQRFIIRVDEDAVYNGQEQQVPFVVVDRADASNPVVVDSAIYNYTYEGDTVSAGEASIVVTAKSGSNYDGQVRATYTIQPAPFGIVTPSAAKSYDGKPLSATAGAYVAGLQGDDEVQVNCTTEVTIGYADNVVEVEDLIWVIGESSNYVHDASMDSIGNLNVTKADFSELLDSANPSSGKRFVIETETATYDGLAHESLTGVRDLKMGTLIGLNDGAFVTEGENATVAYKDNVNAGTASVTVTASSDSPYYTGSAEGTFEVQKRTVVLASGDAEQYYDSSELRNESMTVGGEGFAQYASADGDMIDEADGVTFTFTGKRSAPGTSANSFEWKFDENIAKAANYDVQPQLGSLTVLSRINETADMQPIPLKLKANSDRFLYDGQAHAVEGYEAQFADIVDASKLTIVGLESGSVAQTEAGTYTASIRETDAFQILQDGVNVRSEFAIEIESGQLVIAPRTVNLKSEDLTREFDGKVLQTVQPYEAAVEVSGDGWAEGEGATYEFTAARTNPGETVNKFTYELKDNTNVQNYNISVEYGTLYVSKKDAIVLTVSLVDSKVQYNGYEQTSSVQFQGGATSSPISIQDDGQTLSLQNAVIEQVSATDVAVDADGNVTGYPVYASLEGEDAIIINEAGENVSADYIVRFEPALFVIEPIGYKVSTAGGTFEYDGNPHANTGVDINIAWMDCFTRDVVSYSTKNSFIDITNGTKSNDYEIVFKEGKAKNYVLEGEDIGQVEITKADMNNGRVIVNIKNVTYTGLQSQPEITVTDATTHARVRTDQFEFEYVGDRVNVTDGPVKVTVKPGPNCNYTGSATGEYRIEKARFGITTGSASKTYDGKWLSAEDSAVITGLQNGEVATIKATGAIRLGSVKNTYANLNTIVWETAKESNYLHDEKLDEIGTLEVRTADLNEAYDESDPDGAKRFSIVLADNSPKYNGTEQQLLSYVYDARAKQPLDSALYDVAYTGNKDAGTATVTVTMKDQGENATITGQLVKQVVIAKRTVVLTSETASRIYNGQALTRPEVLVSGDGFVEGEVTNLEAYGSVTNANDGEMPNWIRYTRSSSFKASNYDITIQQGTLMVTQAVGDRDFIGHINMDSWIYGANHEGLTYSIEAVEEGATADYPQPVITYYQFIDGEEVFFSNNEAPVNVGDYRVQVFWTGTYNVSDIVKTSNFQISKHGIIIESASDAKPYDGKPLVNKTVTVKSADASVEDGWIGNDGDDFTYEVTGSQTNYGASKNDFTYEIPETVNLNNYNITVSYGQLVVYNENAKSANIDIKAKSETVTYDGTKHVINELEEPSIVVDGVEYVVTGMIVSGESTDVTGPEGVAVNIIGTPKIVIKGTNTDMTDYFGTKTIEAGRLIVNPATVTVTTPSKDKVFDGTPLTYEEGMTVTGFFNGDVASWKATGSVTAVTSDEGVDNTYELTWKNADASRNYVVNDNLGKLKVTPATVSDDDVTTNPTDSSKRFVVSQPQDVKYNGQSQKQAITVLDNANASKTLIQDRDYTVAYASSNEADTQAKDAGDITATVTLKGNYSGEVVRNYTIQKRTVALSSESAQKTYDGSRLYRPTVKQEGDGLVASEVKTLQAVGSVTNVVEGEVANTIQFVGNDRYNENNYDWQGTSEGTLKVNPRVIKLISANRSKSYDGTPLNAGGLVSVSPSDGWVFSSEIPSYTFSGSRTLVGTTAGNVSAGTGNAFSFQNSAALQNYSITKQYGSLSVIDEGITGTARDAVVKKTHEGGKTYGLGDVITFNVVATNIYDEAKSITLTERTASTFTQADGGTISADGTSVVFADVPAGQTRTATAVYEVKEADIVAQEFTNIVGVSYGKNEVARNTDTVPAAAFENATPAVSIAKADANAANNPIYNTGDGIVYSLNVTNTGNVTLRNLRVADPLTNDTWSINALVPNQSRSLATGTYRVTSADIVAGRVSNTAQVTAATVPSSDAGQPAVQPLAVPVNSNTVVSKVAVAGPAITLQKEAQAADGTVLTDAMRVAKGDTVNYVITVTNNGNVAANDLAIDDDQANLHTTLDTLAPSSSQTFEATHVIDEADILAGSYTNTATVTATAADSTELTSSDSATVRTEAATSNVSVVKSVVNAPENGEYAIGDAIQFQIAVTNEGNVAASNVSVADVLKNATGSIQFDDPAGGEVDGNTVTFDSVASGETKTINATYTIQERDYGKAISNAAVVSGSGNSTSDTSEATAASVQETYRLTVNFVYADGSDAAQSVTGRYAEGATYSVEIPQIEGYTATTSDGSAVTDALVGTMPARNLTVHIVYVADSAIDAAANAATAGPGDAATTAAAPAAAAAAATANAGAAAADAATAAAAQQAAEGNAARNATVTIDDEGNPLVQTIGDGEVPLAPGLANNTWSPIDVILALATLIMAAFALTRTLGSRREEEEAAQSKRTRYLALATVIPALAALILVLATQDFTATAIATDTWTAAFAVLVAANVALVILSGLVTTNKETPVAA